MTPNGKPGGPSLPAILLEWRAVYRQVIERHNGTTPPPAIAILVAGIMDCVPARLVFQDLFRILSGTDHSQPLALAQQKVYDTYRPSRSDLNDLTQAAFWQVACDNLLSTKLGRIQALALVADAARHWAAIAPPPADLAAQQAMGDLNDSLEILRLAEEAQF